MKCRHCQTPLTHTLVDLGFAPPSNAYLTEDDLQRPESTYPLKVLVCDKCWLVQTQDFIDAQELFQSDYAYFSSTSSGWLRHAAAYSESIIEKLSLSQESFVVEIASNDGYLLKNFVQASIPCLGVEPTKMTADAARTHGIPVLEEFFGESLAESIEHDNAKADLIIGNNVYAHVPDINDFTAGLSKLLKPDGTLTLEFPHLLNLLKFNQFDTIYHEHFSYLSLSAVSTIFKAHQLRVYEVEKLSTHGGSLRVYGCHDNADIKTQDSVNNLLDEEEKFGITQIETYSTFQESCDTIRYALLDYLIAQKRANQTVIAYGAAAKGNTLLNFAGVKSDLIAYVVDAAEAKQGKFMPGSHIPIYSPEKLKESHVDNIIVLPWNIVEEISLQLQTMGIRDSQVTTFIPELLIRRIN